MALALTDGTLYAGGLGYGQIPYAGEVLLVVKPPALGQALPGLVANDRHQIVLLVDEGAPGVLSEWRGWTGAPVEWGEIMGSLDPDLLVPRLATDELGNLVFGNVELPALAVDKGNEATVAGLLVEIDARPAIIDVRDGGVPPGTMLGFDAYVEGWRGPDLDVRDAENRKSSVVQSDTVSWEIAASLVDDAFFPARFTVRMPCRITAQVRSLRVGLLNVRGIEIVSVEAYGTPVVSRFE